MKLRERQKARDDIDAIYLTFYEIDPELARRFSEAYERAVNLMLSHPLIGPRTPHAPARHRIRFWLLSKPFNRYLIFYKAHAGTLEIIRVLHGAQDLPKTVK